MIKFIEEVLGNLATWIVLAIASAGLWVYRQVAAHEHKVLQVQKEMHETKQTVDAQAESLKEIREEMAEARGVRERDHEDILELKTDVKAINSNILDLIKMFQNHHED